MKRILIFAWLLAAACCWSCSESDDAAPKLRVLTFEDADYAGSASAAGGYWTSLVDIEQYMGSLLYGNAAGYVWYDERGTGLTGGMLGTDFWDGGDVISNYYMANYAKADYTMQLTVSTSANGAGHDGSKNFCVHNGYVDATSYKQELSALRFKSVEPHVVDHMWVVNTSYVLAFLENGNSFASAAGENSWFKIVAVGYDAAGAVTGSCDFYLCRGRSFVTEWTKFELWSLGAVSRIEFNMAASEDLCGEWGMNVPAYFAFDDVAVRF